MVYVGFCGVTDQSPAAQRRQALGGGRTLEEAAEKAKKLAGSAKFTLEQDEDVLDTWFSSGLGLSWAGRRRFVILLPTRLLSSFTIP